MFHYVATASMLSIVLGSINFVPAVSIECEPPQPFVRYTFNHRSCNEGIFPESASLPSAPQFPPFKSNKVEIACAEDLGVESTGGNDSVLQESPSLLLNASGTEKIVRHIQRQKNGISFEFWLKTTKYNADENFASIFTVGASDQPVNNKARNTCDRNHFDLHLGVSGKNFEVTFRSSDPYFYPCYSVPVPVNHSQDQPGELMHLVIVLEDNRQQVFVNGLGGQVAKEPFSNGLFHWSSSFAMKFFSSTGRAQQDSVWAGRLYQFSVYDFPLASTEVKESMIAGLPRGRPFATSYQINVNEDAEALPGSHEPEWYSSPPLPTKGQSSILADLQRIQLRSGTVSDEVQDLLYSKKLPYLKCHSSDSPPHFYITNFPSRGKLFQILGDRVLELHVPPTGSSEETYAVLVEAPDALVYLPPFNEHSELPGAEFTRMMYCVSDRYIFDPAQCESKTISIVVDPVNDPPVAISQPDTMRSLEGPETDITPYIELYGSDVDKGDNVTFIQVIEPPKWGSLLLRVTEFRGDGLLHGTHLSGTNNKVRVMNGMNGKSIYAKYVFNQTRSGVSQQVVPGNDAFDFFRFRVLDQHGSWSSERTVQIHIASQVQVKPNPPVAIKCDAKDTVIPLHGIDKSGMERPIGFFIQSVPHEQEGFLLIDYHSGHRLEAGSIVPAANGSESYILVRAQSCSSCPLNGTLDFTYRAIAIQHDMVVSKSPIARQALLRKECQESTKIELSTPHKFNVQKFGLVAGVNEACQDVVSTSSDVSFPSFRNSCLMTNVLDEVKVSGKSGLVLVTVLPGKGYITFNKDSWHKVNLIRGRQKLSSKNVTFSAQTEDLANIFEGLSFGSHIIGKDSIDIVLKYGHCLGTTDSFQLPAGFNEADCYVQAKTIAVIVGDVRTDSLYELAPMGFPWQVMFCWLGYPFLYFGFSVWKKVSNSGRDKLQKMIYPSNAQGDSQPDV